MKLLAIETSCDETAIAVVEKTTNGSFSIHSHKLFSQIKLHEEYGGVFPNVAKREHEKILIPLLLEALSEAGIPFSKTGGAVLNLDHLFSQNHTLHQIFKEKLEGSLCPGIDAIAVTIGPGLEPALWTGITLAKALSLAWNKPLIPVNHLHGHLASVLAEGREVPFPAVGFIVSGGHTQLILLKDWHTLSLLGETRDDAVGEAYDKTARLFGIPYPGGAALSKRAAEGRESGETSAFSLPSPMLTSKDLDFSFSGLKTAARYALRDNELLANDEGVQNSFFQAFEESVAAVLTKKCTDALRTTGAKSLLFTGGVSANPYLREQLSTVAEREGVSFFVPPPALSTDNAVMIGLSGLLLKNSALSPEEAQSIEANGSLSLT